MKKVLALVLMLLMLSVCSIASADRPQELQAEAAQLLKNQSDAQQVLRNIEVRLVEINGALKEYALQAAKEEVPEVPEVPVVAE